MAAIVAVSLFWIGRSLRAGLPMHHATYVRHTYKFRDVAKMIADLFVTATFISQGVRVN